MGERRGARRRNVRLQVHFGERGRDFEWMGFTANVSAGGFFVVSAHVPRPGTRLHAQLALRDGPSLFLEGVVTRQVLVPPGLRRVTPAGFGFRYATGAEVLEEVLPSVFSTLTPVPMQGQALVVHHRTAEDCRTALEGELRHGGAFVWSDHPVPFDAPVKVLFDLAFCGRRPTFDALVVHTSLDVGGRTGVAVRFADPAAVTTSLAAALGH